MSEALDFTVGPDGLGGCDILVNAQGINQKMFSWEIDTDYFEKMLHTNITSMMFTCRYFGNWMKDHNLDEGETAVPMSEFKAGMPNPNKGYGKIINFGSVRGIRAVANGGMGNWGWEEMQRRELPIDALGEMWHGKREPDEAIMNHPYKKTYDK